MLYSAVFLLGHGKDTSRQSMYQNESFVLFNHAKPAHFLYPLVKHNLVKINPSILLDTSPA